MSQLSHHFTQKAKIMLLTPNYHKRFSQLVLLSLELESTKVVVVVFISFNLLGLNQI